MKEYTGKSVEELLNEISKAQNCKIEEITYNVLEENKHFLGIGNSVTIEAYTPQDVKEFIFEYLGTYFTELNQAVSIEIIVENNKEKDGELLYRVILDAENNAIIIGKNGQTLRAITTVLKAATNATFKKRINTIVDVNHYKEDRYRKVKAMASRIAKEVSKSHVDASLDPMPADERKVIHQFLQDFKNVETVSEGEGNKRHLVIKYIGSDNEVNNEEEVVD